MKTPRFLFLFLVVAVLAASCGGPPPVPEPTASGEPSPVVEPATPLPTPEPVEASPVISTSTQPQYAPFCETASTGCEAPTVTMLDNKYCIEKVPYAIMSVPAGTTYTTEDPDFQCVDQMHSDGTMRVTCHSLTGKELWSFDLQLCNSACSPPALQMETGQCQEGYGYDPVNQCCAAPAPASNDGCTIYQVDLGACIGS